MARVKNSFKVSREQLELIVEALSNAECWKMEMCERFPHYEAMYSERIAQFLSLEFELREMIGDSIEG